MKLKQLLEQYHIIKLRILVCKEEIEERKRELLPSMAKPPEIGGSSGNFSGSPTEKAVIRFMDDEILRKLEYQKRRAEEQKEFIENIIYSLKEPEQTYFRKRFIEGLTVARVAEECNVTTQYLYNMYSRTFDRIENNCNYTLS